MVLQEIIDMVQFNPNPTILGAVTCDRCHAVIGRFKSEASVPLLAAGIIHLCDGCKSHMGPRDEAALRLRARCGVIYSALRSGIDSPTDLQHENEIEEYL